LTEITNYTGQTNTYDLTKPYEYKNYSSVNYKEYLSPSNQPQSGSKASLTSLDRDKDYVSYSAVPFTYSSYNSQVKNPADKNYGNSGISTSVYMQKSENIVSSSNARPLANSSTYLASQAPTGKPHLIIADL